MQQIAEDSIDVATLAQMVGRTASVVRLDIEYGILLAEKRGTSWCIRLTDAQKYIDLRRAAAQSISAREMERRVGKRHRKTVAQAINNGDLPAFRLRNKWWYIREEDAKAYAVKMGWTYTVEGRAEVPPPKRRVLGTPDKCGSCGTEKGNILGDIDTDSHERYGYLCVRCHKVVREFYGDARRMRMVLAYIEKTRTVK